MKRSLIFLSILILVVFTTSSLFAQKTLKLGDNVNFGYYKGYSISWKVIDVDTDGNFLLWANNILTYKPYDAAESGSGGEEGGKYTEVKVRQKSGSNRWQNSNIREWLNSDSKKVKYTTQSPTKMSLKFERPIAIGSTYDPLININPYDKEPGFLNGFSNNEKKAIVSVTHKTLLVKIDSENKSGGSEELEFGGFTDTPEKALKNYDKCFYEMITDKVFLLSVKELYEFVEKRGVAMEKKPTAIAYRDNKILRRKKTDKNDSYYTRTPYTREVNCIRTVYPSSYGGSYVRFNTAHSSEFGIVPAMYVNPKFIKISSGDGSENSPYKVKR